jgi:hypothetical protein
MLSEIFFLFFFLVFGGGSLRPASDVADDLPVLPRYDHGPRNMLSEIISFFFFFLVFGGVSQAGLLCG